MHVYFIGEEKERGERFRKENKNLLIKHDLKDWEESDSKMLIVVTCWLPG